MVAVEKQVNGQKVGEPIKVEPISLGECIYQAIGTYLKATGDW